MIQVTEPGSEAVVGQVYEGANGRVFVRVDEVFDHEVLVTLLESFGEAFYQPKFVFKAGFPSMFSPSARKFA